MDAVINIVNATYLQTGESVVNDQRMGMREMQKRVYEHRNAQYILLKSPPASGKSRALMYVALDKLNNQGIRKVVVTVPQRAIGGSFKNMDLRSGGFFADWEVEPRNNLVDDNDLTNDSTKVDAFRNFMDSEKDEILICTHSALRFAMDKIDVAKFDNTLVAIDEFHHVSADEGNKLGEKLRELIDRGKAHIMAMTGSYFRGDSVPVLLPEDEDRFDKVTYTYYEQLNGYKYLKTLGIGYHFYQGKYTSAIQEVLDTDKKTIIHIPHTMARESFDKQSEVGIIIDIIGKHISTDEKTGILTIERRSDGKYLKVADLVEDSDIKSRENTLSYLRDIKNRDDLDIIIAMGMAKEGFDWTFCETALTIGYRKSFTEIVQIIGRTTRDCEGKSHAQFINLVAEPDAEDVVVIEAVNDTLKAITVALLMEQVLAPNFKFRTKLFEDQQPQPGEILINGLKEPSSKRVKSITENDLNDLKVAILDDEQVKAAMIDATIPPQVINRELIPKIIREKYPNLKDNEVEEVRQHIVADTMMRSCNIDREGDLRFVHNGEKFVNIDKLNIDLIDSISPFQLAYQVHSKKLSESVFKLIGNCISSSKINMTDEEAVLRYEEIKAFFELNNCLPDYNSSDKMERRLGEAWIYIQRVNNEGRY